MRPTRRDNDDRPCALVFRKTSEDAWELHCYTLSISVAWRTADMLGKAWRDEGVEEVQVAVMLRELYDEKRGMPLVPPQGFEHLDLSIQNARRGHHKRSSVKTNIVPDIKDEGLGAIDKDMDF